MSTKSDKITTKTKEFFDKIGVPGEISCEEKDDYSERKLETSNFVQGKGSSDHQGGGTYFYLNLKAEEPASLIGYHGQTLDALQLILNLILTKSLGEYVKVVLDISDWRKRREETVKEIAQKAAIRAKFSGQPQVLKGLKAFERRIIHMVLSDHPDVTTQSEGEGEERVIKILPKV